MFPGGTSVKGTLNSTPDTTFRVEVFANDDCDPSGNGEGQAFVGANDSVATDANGDASFTVIDLPGFAHRVDQAIVRDVVVARSRPRSTT